MGLEGVKTTTADMCMYGLTTRGAKRSETRAAKKRTRFMTNCDQVAGQLATTCDGEHEHQHLVNGRAQAAAQYTPRLCRAICTGLADAIKYREQGLRKIVELTSRSQVDEENTSAEHEECVGEAWDDMTGALLNPREVRGKAKLVRVYKGEACMEESAANRSG